ncbi:MAG: PIN domain-containing protein [Candidatus Aenigmarchaeota archaeon]|nr:PIN domain-containing protein [Candidatus Aenigmarchaeota archaeon]
MRKKNKKFNSKNNNKCKWYYDACALDKKVDIYNKIYSCKKRNTISLTSALSIGEAYKNCYYKGNDQVNDFVSLINKMSSKYGLEIVSNKDIDKQFTKIREKFDHLSITDAIHFATAIRHECEILVSIDNDFTGLNKKDVEGVAKELGLKKFSILDLNKK